MKTWPDNATDTICKRPEWQCSGRLGFIVISHCDICEDKHAHLMCVECGYQFNEWAKDHA